MVLTEYVSMLEVQIAQKLSETVRTLRIHIMLVACALLVVGRLLRLTRLPWMQLL